MWVKGMGVFVCVLIGLALCVCGQSVARGGNGREGKQRDRTARRIDSFNLISEGEEAVAALLRAALSCGLAGDRTR